MLSAKQKLFIEKYVETGNAIEAYMIAYDKTEKDPGIISNANRALRIRDVKACLDKLLDEKAREAYLKSLDEPEVPVKTIRRKRSPRKPKPQPLKGKELKPAKDNVSKIENNIDIPEDDIEGNSGPEIMSVVYRGLLKQHSVDALQTIIDIMNDPKTKTNHRIAAASIVLDRAIGKISFDSVFENEDLNWINVIPEEEIKCPDDKDLIVHWQSLERKYRNA
jgi:hypothetical protein